MLDQNDYQQAAEEIPVHGIVNSILSGQIDQGPTPAENIHINFLYCLPSTGIRNVEHHFLQ